jgi:hypothetical protein|tara:strand:+ start:41 stop:316 length:276 start_codon:yes stop_codon:yes gene_type:complete
MGYKMKGSPLLKDVKMYDGNGESVTVDDASLGKAYRDKNGNKARDYTYTGKDGEEGVDVLYMTKPRGPSKWEGGGLDIPHDRPIEPKRNLA